ncbi:hypothetical protein IP90_02437 [Luteimonas cucumeris]|uniref:Lipocalin-like protein n=1 Tax=Luteimonas cucumeris TaxID=985012 RepID=A0A562L2K4_9GAMM|nr:hypothetical protein [Luteimonas cucumeris]TWI01877.1 hypothetical protein IP90_02437 [Luteimonas cucumeris]
MKPTFATSIAIIAAMLAVACNKPQPAETASTAAAPASPATQASTAPAVADDALPAFVGKVWQVQESSAIAPGTRYSFLVDGRLVIDAEGGTPGYGKWTYENGALTMIEEGVSYPTDILKLDATTFQIRSHNPGEPVTITLVPAEGVPLPTVPAR